MTYRIMIIDDNKPLADAIKSGINWQSLHAEVAYLLYDALSVYEILKTEQIDLIISDIRMPGLSGLEMARHILSEQYDTKIILISAYEDFQYVQEAIRIGAVDYIEKPVNFDYLKRIIKKALQQIEEGRQIKKQIEESKPAMKEKLFQYLLWHTPSETHYQYREYPSFLSMDTESNFHLCFITKITNAAAYQKQIGLVRYLTEILAFQNLILEYVSSYTLSCLLQNGSSLILFLGHTVKNQEQFYHLVQKSLEPILNAPSPFRICIGVGSPVRSFWNLRESYENALLALDYRFFLPEEQLFYWRDMPQKTFLPDMNLDTKCNKIIKLICQNQQKELKAYLDSLYQDYFDLNMNRTGFIFAVSDLSNRITGYLLKMGVAANFLERMPVNYKKMESFNTGTELFEWLYQLCLLACRELESSVSFYQTRLTAMADSYIQEHFSDSCLNLNEIAEYVNITPTHLSAAFKKNTGENISDRIARTRIAYASELLKNSNFTVKEISEKAGFSNQYYFSSCFKKIIGVTPSQYRNREDGEI